MMQGVKYRNMMGQVGLFIITLGIYGIYWFYVTADEMKYLAKDEAASPALWTVLLFIPLASFYSIYKYSEIFQKISSDSLNLMDIIPTLDRLLPRGLVYRPNGA